MSDDPAGEATVCAVCGRVWREEDKDRELWLGVEVTRTDETMQSDWLYGDFCSQDHASRWFTRPLPPIKPVDDAPVPRTLKDRLVGLLVGLLFVWALALMLLGSYALVRLLGG